jgi:hypothetical protein
MFSRMIDLSSLSVDEQKKQKKSEGKAPAPFSKDKPKKGLKVSKEMHDSTLEAFKHLLAEQKNDRAISFANTLAPLATSAVEVSAPSLEIDPSAQVSQLFEKLVDRLMVQHDKGIQETSFCLDGEAFESSVFSGAKVTITEYSTAPKVFNIDFSADPKALQLFELHAAEMINALNKGYFGFEVHRIDTTLLTEDEKHALPPVESATEKEER